MDITGVSNERARRLARRRYRREYPFIPRMSGLHHRREAGRPIAIPQPGRSRKSSRTVGRLDGQWAYHLANGEELFRVIRFYTSAGKTFRLIHRQPAGWLPGPTSRRAAWACSLVSLATYQLGEPGLRRRGRKSRRGLQRAARPGRQHVGSRAGVAFQVGLVSPGRQGSDHSARP